MKNYTGRPIQTKNTCVGWSVNFLNAMFRARDMGIFDMVNKNYNQILPRLLSVNGVFGGNLPSNNKVLQNLGVRVGRGNIVTKTRTPEARARKTQLGRKSLTGTKGKAQKRLGKVRRVRVRKGLGKAHTGRVKKTTQSRTVRKKKSTQRRTVHKKKSTSGVKPMSWSPGAVRGSRSTSGVKSMSWSPGFQMSRALKRRRGE